MHGRLVVVSGPEKGSTIEIPERGKITLGRGQASDTRLNDPRISRVHCTLEFTPRGAVLADAGSTGGTFVADRPIQQHRLTHGEEFSLGDSRIRFEVAGKQAAEQGTKKTPRLSAKSLNDLTGQTLGHFKLDRIHHTGGSSILFRARDIKHDRDAIVKVMLPSVTSDDERRSRFVRAVHTMIKVRHDNLVEIYGAGKQGPFCWCAMEFVDGISILDMIELIGVQGRLDWREVFRIGVHIARALECAHRNKVIHRNVTPDNLLQRKNDKVVKLCDLMLAKALEGTQAKQVTAPGQLIGNVAYMSPERMIDTSSLDWRSDQYGLGATLFALLTGGPPFSADTLPELVQSVRSESPIFSEDVCTDTPQEFRDAVITMLGKTPESRFLYPSLLLQAFDEIGKQYDVDADVLFNR